MSRLVALGAVLGFAVAVLALALFAKEPPHAAPAPEAPPVQTLSPQPLLRPVPLRKDLSINGPLKAVLPPHARQMLIAPDAGAAP